MWHIMCRNKSIFWRFVFFRSKHQPLSVRSGRRKVFPEASACIKLTWECALLAVEGLQKCRRRRRLLMSSRFFGNVLNFQMGALFFIARLLALGLDRMSQSKCWQRNKCTWTGRPTKPLILKNDPIKGGFYMLHGNVCSIYPSTLCDVELCVYTVNDWIGTVYLVIQLWKNDSEWDFDWNVSTSMDYSPTKSSAWCLCMQLQTSMLSLPKCVSFSIHQHSSVKLPPELFLFLSLTQTLHFMGNNHL